MNQHIASISGTKYMYVFQMKFYQIIAMYK